MEENEAKVEQEKAKVEQEKVKVEQQKIQVEEDKAQVEQEKVKLTHERAKVEQEKVKVDEERVKMEKLSKELQSQVECPVCLTLPREDRAVPCCPQGHIVCSSCRDQSIRQAKSRYITIT